MLARSGLLMAAMAGALAVAQSAQAGPLVNGSFETGDFTGWTRSGFFNFLGSPTTGGPNYTTFTTAQSADAVESDSNAVVTAQTSGFDGAVAGPSIAPASGNYLAFASNEASGGDATLTGSAIAQTFTVPLGATRLNFDVRLLNNDNSYEFADFDDFGGVALTQGSTIIAEFNLDLDPNSTADVHVTVDTNQGGFFNSTAWLSESFDVAAFAGQDVTLTAYALQYGGDNQVETRLLLDNVGTSGTPAIPEPGTLALFGMGLAGLGMMGRRRRARMTA